MKKNNTKLWRKYEEEKKVVQQRTRRKKEEPRFFVKPGSTKQSKQTPKNQYETKPKNKSNKYKTKITNNFFTFYCKFYNYLHFLSNWHITIIVTHPINN